MVDKTIYIFRHGETDWIEQHLCQGVSDVPSLNAKGIEQAESAANAAKTLGVEVVYSSPLKRARQTASIVAERCNVPVILDAGLSELDYGDATGLPVEQAKALYPEVFRDWLETDLEHSRDCAFPNGETKDAFNDRIREALHRIFEEAEHEVLAIATHSGVIWNYIQYGLGVDCKPPKCGQGFKLRYSGGSVIFDGPILV
ncbi:MAG: histidine phosphatase family protein [Alphaproteobacteria bacterium]|nr:histidine phosphatase family protein [Alphaproteobacteria bacterium]